MRKPKGFTLIELLVVIAIIALLLAILMPSLKLAKEHAKRLLCGKDLSTIGVALAMYAGQEDDLLPTHRYSRLPAHSYYFGNYGDPANVDALNAGSVDVRLNNLLSTAPGVPGGPTNLGYLMSTDLIDSSVPKIFYCASNKGDRFSFETYGGKEEWPISRGNLWDETVNPTRIRTSYSYIAQHRYKHNDLGDFPANATKYSQMDPTRSVVMDLLTDAENMSHISGGYLGVNVLYGDGSVTFKRDEGNIINKAQKEHGNLFLNKNKVLFRELIKAINQW